jgi:hypothetical protein
MPSTPAPRNKIQSATRNATKQDADLMCLFAAGGHVLQGVAQLGLQPTMLLLELAWHIDQSGQIVSAHS